MLRHGVQREIDEFLEFVGHSGESFLERGVPPLVFCDLVPHFTRNFILLNDDVTQEVSLLLSYYYLSVKCSVYAYKKETQLYYNYVCVR